MAIHDPGKIVLDLAVTLTIGGDCAADLALLRAEPSVFGSVASDPTVSRSITALAADAPKVLAAIASARVDARARAWTLAGSNAPDHRISINDPMIIDLDATLTDAQSEKQHAAPTFKRGFGLHSRWSFIDHGPGRDRRARRADASCAVSTALLGPGAGPAQGHHEAACGRARTVGRGGDDDARGIPAGDRPVGQVGYPKGDSPKLNENDTTSISASDGPGTGAGASAERSMCGPPLSWTSAFMSWGAPV